MANERLAGKVAVVTGGGRGLGRAAALAFVSQGASVAIVSRTESELSEVVRWFCWMILRQSASFAPLCATPTRR